MYCISLLKMRYHQVYIVCMFVGIFRFKGPKYWLYTHSVKVTFTDG